MNAAFVTVRTDSTRFPCKAIWTMCGKFTIEYVIERAKESNADKVILCTTELKNDDILIRIAKALQIDYFRGSTEDKLMRWKGAVDQFGVDFFVTFDGDDLFCDSTFANLAFQQYQRYNSDFIEAKNVPCGTFTYGISASALNKVCEIKGTTDTEMMAPYFTDTGLFKVEQLEGVPVELQRPDLRLTLDYDADFRQYEICLLYTSPSPRD